MKRVAWAVAVAAAMIALPAVAEETSGQGSTSSGGVIDWLASAVGISESADQTVDEKKQPAKTEAGKSGVDPIPMAVPEEGPTDKDSYKPDAGEMPN